jgi:hypothetical protein
MSLFALYYNGKGPKPPADMKIIRWLPGVVVISDAAPRNVTLRISSDVSRQRLKNLPGWTLYKSQPVSIEEPSLEGAPKVPGLRLV